MRRGAKGVFQLRGCLPIALWDAAQTDATPGAAIGQASKPLYYTQAADRLFFGSEAKCLLVNPEVDRTVDLAR
jgi:hypothetical protein